jgi:transcriptional regulator with XRE-family HTH domain
MRHNAYKRLMNEPMHKRLRRLREARGLSVKEVALRLEVPLTTYREWEYGRAIRGEPYVQLARILGVSLCGLLGAERAEGVASLPSVGVELLKLEEMVRQLRARLG